jgi:hypothetical protein
MSAKASLSFDIYLRATPQQVRAVLADPVLAPRWLAGIRLCGGAVGGLGGPKAGSASHHPDHGRATHRLGGQE